MSEQSASKPQTALICVDVQNDFLPGGALAVAGGDQVIERLREAATRSDLVVASQDFHPRDHVSFIANGGDWPAHCVAGTHGAELHPEIDRLASHVARKATEPEPDAYSAFDRTGLSEHLHARGVERVLVGGLATDYCVKETVLDALDAGFEAVLLTDASRGIDAEPGDERAAVEQMRAAGAEIS